jgi:type IV pilus assembly protein PilQ
MKSYHRRRLVLLALVASPLLAQTETPVETPAAQTPPATEVAPPAQPPAAETVPVATELTALPPAPAAEVVEAPPEKAKDTLSVDFPDEDVRNILRNVADLFELNLVMPDTLQGRTSIKLRDVSWRQIFKVVLSPVGYTFVEDGNIIKIVTNESLTQEPLITEVYVLNYARAEEIEKSITPLVDAPGGGRVLVDKRINALIISERPTRLGRITPVLQQLDKPTDQVMIESKFIEVTDNDVKNLGVNWASLSGYGVRAGPFQRDFERERGKATNTGSVLTQTPIFDGNGNVIGTNSVVTPTNTAASIASTSRLDTAVFTADQFGVVLSALNTVSDRRVVSNPTVVTLNNVEASINIGEEYPIPSYTYNAERGAFEISGFDYRPIGINLKVTPQVNNASFIRLLLEPEISERGDSVSFGGASGAEIPVINSRKTKTQVTMKDGNTLAIGGLMRDVDRVGGTRVPVLGSIPGLGRLFRSDTKSKERQNLIIFITARTINSETAKPEDVFDARALQGAAVKRSDLPGFRVMTEDPYTPEAAPATEKTKGK